MNSISRLDRIRPIFIFMVCLIGMGFFCRGSLFAYSRGICESAGYGRVSFHYHVGYRHSSRRADNLLFLMMLSSTSTTTYCLSIANEEERWQERRYSRKDRYSYINYDDIKTDVARGYGEHLTVLSYLFGCSKESGSDFAAVLRSNYKELFPKGPITESSELIPKIRNLILGNDRLSESCRERQPGVRRL